MTSALATWPAAGTSPDNAYARSQAQFDLAARRLGLDPLELRRRHVIDDADLPYTTAAGMDHDQASAGPSLW